MRKIIQISENPSHGDNQGWMTALCDDGTMWQYACGAWSKFPVSIPQDEESTSKVTANKLSDIELTQIYKDTGEGLDGMFAAVSAIYGE